MTFINKTIGSKKMEVKEFARNEVARDKKN